MQVSPSGMAAASQAVPGEFDSRHLLQKKAVIDYQSQLFSMKFMPVGISEIIRL